MLMGRFLGFSFVMAHVRCASEWLANHGQARPKNQIWAEEQSPTAQPTARATTHEETMQFKHVTLDFDGPVAILKLDHQEVMNAVSIDMLGGLG